MYDNLEHLGLDVLEVVNLRLGGLDGPTSGSVVEPFTALAQLQQEGVIKHLGMSTVSAEQISEAQSIAPIVCVQDFYNVAHRVDDELIDALAAQGIPYVPYFPLGGFTPLQSGILDAVATRLGTTPMAVALGVVVTALTEYPAYPRNIIRRVSTRQRRQRRQRRTHLVRERRG